MTDMDELSRIRPEPTEPDPATLRHHRDRLLNRAGKRRMAAPRLTRSPKLAIGGTMAAAAAGTAAAVLLTTGVLTPGSEAPSTPAAVGVAGATAQQSEFGTLPSDASPEQWIYVKTVRKTHGAAEPRERVYESWTRVDGSASARRASADGDEYQGSEYRCTEPDVAMCPARGDQPPLASPSYEYLRGLPTDPAALRDVVYEQARRSIETLRARGDELRVPVPSTDQRAYELVYRALTPAAPDNVAEALYRVAVEIPGVSKVRDGLDAVGMNGIGITRDPERQLPDERNEAAGVTERSIPVAGHMYNPVPPMVLVFDEESHQFRGTARLAEQPRTTARVVTRGVVTEKRQVP